MKTNIIRKITLCSCVVAGLGLVSCDDFLTITPTNSIVEEEFWEDKNDLSNVVGACYKRLVDNDMLTKYIQWGEMRSDNFERTAGNSNQDIQNLMNANLLPTNGMFGWTSFYNCINYCNKVLVHGPEILEKDPSFSQGDWEPMRAEVIALRAYCHFWLVRTFGEIPYVTEDYNNDNQELRLPQSTQLLVLDNIIADLESIKDLAMLDYNNNVLNKGRVTRKMVYTFLADVYLWRASYIAGQNKPFTVDGVVGAEQGNTTTVAVNDYNKVIECCDYVIGEMFKDKKKELVNSGAFVGANIELDTTDLFIPNTTVGYKYATTIGSYDYIFGTGNSSESIFELQVGGTNDYTNTMITSMFWNIKDSKSAAISGSNSLFSAVNTTPNVLDPSYIYTKTDMRRWETVQFEKAGQTAFTIAKYIMNMVMYGGTGDLSDNSIENLSYAYSTRSLPTDANWIVYRLSDVLLMKAEAMSQVYSDNDKLTEAFNLCKYVFDRSNPYAVSAAGEADALKPDGFLSQEGIESLVMAERQREFVAEGKRWFDLVRYALRKGNTQNMLTMLTRKYAADSKKAVEAKLSSIQSLFSPIHTNQIKSNDLLHQNEVWATSESTSKTDEL